jgi:hypothetical protein
MTGKFQSQESGENLGRYNLWLGGKLFRYLGQLSNIKAGLPMPEKLCKFEVLDS